MKICGIDASTTCSGFAIFEDGKLVRHEIIDMKKNRNTEERILEMMFELGDLIKTEKPDVLCIEDTWNKQNIETTKMLSNVIGAIMYVCYDLDCEFNKYLPSVWRSAIGLKLSEGKHKLTRPELKQEAIDYVNKTYGVKCNDDEAEAICIAEAGGVLHDGDDLF